MTTPAAPRRRWFSYSLRTGFVLLTLFCVWLGVQVKWVKDRREAHAFISAHVLWDNGMDYEHHRLVTANYPLRPAPWPLRWLGESASGGIKILDIPDTGAEIERLRKLFPESTIQGRQSTEAAAASVE